MTTRRTAIDDYKVGDKSTYAKTITETDAALFGAVSGDVYPKHFNEELAKRTRFGGRIAHGLITLGVASTALGAPLQGSGVCAAVEKELHVNFIAPVRFGDTVTVEARVEEVITERRIVNLSIVCRNQREEIVLNGQAVIKLLKEVITA